MTFLKRNLMWLVIVAAFFAPLSAIAAEWKPSGNMRMIVASGAGGAYDVLARAMSKLWPKYFGVKIIVQNIRGAKGSLGMDRIATAKPDGQIIGFSSRGPYLGELLRRSFKWKLEDLPVIMAAKTPPYVVSTGIKSPFKSWADVRKAKRPIRIGVATTMTSEVVIIKDLLANGVSIRTGTMKTTEIITSLIAGDLDLWSSVSSATLMDTIKSGNVRPLLTFDTKRFDGLPNVPMLTEVGMPPHWNAVGAIRMWLAPIGTPPAIVSSIASRMKKLLEDPKIKGWAYKSGFVHSVIGGTEAKNSQSGLLKIIKDNEDIFKKYGG